MRDRWAVLVLLAGCVLPVAACAPSDEPGTLPDRTDSVTTPAPTPAPTVTPTPTDPSAALEAEIETFFRSYIDTVNESWTSADALARRREMFADSCEVCLRGYQFTERALSDELVFEGEFGSLISVDLVSEPGDQVSVLATIVSPAAKLVDGSGATIQEFDVYEALQTAYQVRRLEAGSWLIISGETLE